jgi:uncharacterized OB-fold protein
MATKPDPQLDVWNRPFWDACSRGRLTVQQCGKTGNCWFPPAPVSPFDPKAGWKWVHCEGTGEIVSFVIFHQKYFDGFAEDLPYNVAMVRIKEGPIFVTNVKSDNAVLHVGMPVEVFFERRGEFSIPLFQPARAA